VLGSELFNTRVSLLEVGFIQTYDEVLQDFTDLSTDALSIQTFGDDLQASEGVLSSLLAAFRLLIHIDDGLETLEDFVAFFLADVGSSSRFGASTHGSRSRASSSWWRTGGLTHRWRHRSRGRRGQRRSFHLRWAIVNRSLVHLASRWTSSSVVLRHRFRRSSNCKSWSRRCMNLLRRSCTRRSGHECWMIFSSWFLALLLLLLDDLTLYLLYRSCALLRNNLLWHDRSRWARSTTQTRVRARWFVVLNSSLLWWVRRLLFHWWWRLNWRSS